jgi:tripartite-type tricarboxylate transporter receptor subunit TctC
MTTLLARLAGAAIALFLTAGTYAQTPGQGYPLHPVKIIIPSAPGGASDLSGRIVAQYLTTALGQAFVAEDHPGAGNTLGAGLVAHSAPDGYTLLLADTSHAIAQSVYRHLPYDSNTAFTHVAMIARTPYLLVANPKLGVTDLKGLIALAKAHPGKLTYGSAGVGTGSHLAAELLALHANVDIRHIPYKAGGPALNGVLTGQVDMMFIAAPAAMGMVEAHQLVPIVQTDTERLPALADVPTGKEAGVPDLLIPEWFALSAPAGTPDSVVKMLNREVNKMLAQPDVQQQLARQALMASPMTSRAYADIFNSDIKRYSGVVKAAHAYID